MKKISILLLIGMFFVGCAQETSDISQETPEIIKNKEVITLEGEKFIDVISVIESYGDNEILEYADQPWAVAVRNLKTDYIYYFDSNNNFIGRKKAVIDSNSEGGGRCLKSSTKE